MAVETVESHRNRMAEILLSVLELSRAALMLSKAKIRVMWIFIKQKINVTTRIHTLMYTLILLPKAEIVIMNTFID